MMKVKGREKSEGVIVRVDSLWYLRGGGEGEKVKFSVLLSKDEIEEDFMRVKFNRRNCW